MPSRATPFPAEDPQEMDQRIDLEVQNTVTMGKEIGFQLDGFENAIREEVIGTQKNIEVIQ